MGDPELESLIIAFSQGRAGEAELYAMVVARARPRVASRLGSPAHRHCVEEVLNEIARQVLMQVKKGNGLQQPGSAAAWLLKISEGHVNNYFRRWYTPNGKMLTLDPSEMAQYEAGSDFEDRLEKQEIVERIVAGLKGAERTIAIGIAEGSSTEEMLAKTGLRRATLFRTKERLLKRLRKELGQLLAILLAFHATGLL